MCVLSAEEEAIVTVWMGYQLLAAMGWEGERRNSPGERGWDVLAPYTVTEGTRKDRQRERCSAVTRGEMLCLSQRVLPPVLMLAFPRSARESEDEEEEEEERRQSASRGCTLQYQHATLQVFTQFHTTSSEGTDQVVTMLGPDWLVEVTDLVSDFMRVGDPRVAHLVDSSTLAGLEPGTTPFKVGKGSVQAQSSRPGNLGYP